MAYVILFLLLAIPYFPLFGEIDRIASQWFFLSFVNVFGIAYIFYKKDLKSIFDSNLKRYINMSYVVFLLFCLISIIVAINKVESLIEIFRYSSFFISLLVFQVFTNKINFKIFSIFIILFTSIELLGLLLQYSQDLPLIGFTGNKNIASVSLAIKLNLIYLVIFHSQKQVVKLFLSIIPLLGIWMIFAIGSKLGILLVIVSTICFLLHGVVVYSKKNKTDILKIGVLASILVTINIANNNLTILNEVVDKTININKDEGNTDRLRYYSQTIESFSQNPIFGVGFGNWKIVSIKYDAPSMKNYIVQYHAHNDFLQILAETGLFGFLSIISFFLMIGIRLVKNLKSNSASIFILLAFVCYLADMNINFPSARVIAQLNLCLIIALDYLINSENKNE